MSSIYVQTLRGSDQGQEVGVIMVGHLIREKMERQRKDKMVDERKNERKREMGEGEGM